MGDQNCAINPCWIPNNDITNIYLVSLLDGLFFKAFSISFVNMAKNNLRELVSRLQRNWGSNDKRYKARKASGFLLPSHAVLIVWLTFYISCSVLLLMI